jgi:glycosyltransferase involved in cell wall biosynthesis
MKRLAIVSTHPIQYNAPLFQLIATNGVIHIKVFYTWGESILSKKYDPGFGKNVEWDIPLLQGYDYTFVKNISPDPGSHSYKGIDNPSLISEIKRWEASALLVYGWSFKSHLQCLRHFNKKIPVFFRGDSTLIDPQPFLKKIFRFCFLRWVYSHIDIALYVGANNKKYFEKYGVQSSRLVFAPHAIDNDRFSDDEVKNYEQSAILWRNELSIPQGSIVFLFAGKLEEKKDPSLLVNAFNDINKDGNHYLLIAGNGHLENELKNKSTDNSCIKFIGFQNQSVMPVLYRIADCVVLPSKGPNETWGLSVNEALASARPVIVSNKCGCAIDLIQSGVNGYIFSSSNKEDLKSKMKIFIEEKRKGNDMKAKALAGIQAWCFGEICKQVEAITL